MIVKIILKIIPKIILIILKIILKISLKIVMIILKIIVIIVNLAAASGQVGCHDWKGSALEQVPANSFVINTIAMITMTMTNMMRMMIIVMSKCLQRVLSVDFIKLLNRMVDADDDDKDDVDYLKRGLLVSLLNPRHCVHRHMPRIPHSSAYLFFFVIFKKAKCLLNIFYCHSCHHDHYFHLTVSSCNCYLHKLILIDTNRITVINIIITMIFVIIKLITKIFVISIFVTIMDVR